MIPKSIDNQQVVAGTKEVELWVPNASSGGSSEEPAAISSRLSVAARKIKMSYSHTLFHKTSRVPFVAFSHFAGWLLTLFLLFFSSIHTYTSIIYIYKRLLLQLASVELPYFSSIMSLFVVALCLYSMYCFCVFCFVLTTRHCHFVYFYSFFLCIFFYGIKFGSAFFCCQRLEPVFNVYNLHIYTCLYVCVSVWA